MNQSQLEQAVARATGESRTYIRRMGFGLMIRPDPPSLFQPIRRRSTRIRRSHRSPESAPVSTA